MLNNEWRQVVGISNMGDDEETVVAKKEGDSITIAYAAYGGIKLVEFSGVTDIDEADTTELDFALIISEMGDSWEVAVSGLYDNSHVIICVDSYEDINIITLDSDDKENSIKVTSTEEYDAEEVWELDEELLRLFHLV